MVSIKKISWSRWIEHTVRFNKSECAAEACPLGHPSNQQDANYDDDGEVCFASDSPMDWSFTPFVAQSILRAHPRYTTRKRRRQDNDNHRPAKRMKKMMAEEEPPAIILGTIFVSIGSSTVRRSSRLALLPRKSYQF